MPSDGLGKVYLSHLPLWFTHLMVLREGIQAGPLLWTAVEILALLALWPQAAPIPHPTSVLLPGASPIIQEPGNEIGNTHSFVERESHPRAVGLSRHHQCQRGEWEVCEGGEGDMPIFFF